MYSQIFTHEHSCTNTLLHTFRYTHVDKQAQLSLQTCLVDSLPVEYHWGPRRWAEALDTVYGSAPECECVWELPGRGAPGPRVYPGLGCVWAGGEQGP